MGHREVRSVVLEIIAANSWRRSSELDLTIGFERLRRKIGEVVNNPLSAEEKRRILNEIIYAQRLFSAGGLAEKEYDFLGEYEKVLGE